MTFNSYLKEIFGLFVLRQQLLVYLSTLRNFSFTGFYLLLTVFTIDSTINGLLLHSINFYMTLYFIKQRLNQLEFEDKFDDLNFVSERFTEHLIFEISNLMKIYEKF